MSLTPGSRIAAGGNLISGYLALKEGLETSSLLKEQGALVKDDYYKQADLVRETGHRTRAKQAMEFISSGVELVGTPQLVLRETLAKSVEKARSLEVTGGNVEALYKRKAKQAKNEGWASFISGVLSAGAMLV